MNDKFKLYCASIWIFFTDIQIYNTLVIISYSYVYVKK